MIELPRHRAVLAQIAARAGEGAAQIGNGAIAIVGDDLHDEGHTVRAIAFKGRFFKSRGILIQTGAPANGTLDVVLGHALCAGFIHHQPQFVVGIGIGAFARGDGDFTSQASKGGASLGVIGAFLAFDGCPVAVT